MATKPSFLIDTNVLAYAYDRSEPAKQAQALALLDRVVGVSALSTQVLGELFIVLTRKLPRPFPPKIAKERVENYLRAWPVLPVTPLIVHEAVRGVAEHGFSYWDAQIWATARLNQIPIVLSEDFSHGRFVEGVRFLNPFTPGVELPV
ncbi:MAG: PIN domain-containing protein [Candidatus Bipolaricaulota bacterium]|nr:PIN domain-containing protein [Candidatus Bipolaricaulota bacterium]MCS7274375.1 PIN domain-containing protein [Candidatus Bipolaricaulota bacterium]MDW8111560.1 PIN domain-containing protein [Candidatus Bipolaricaulota bacterium]MDW8329795.1 PIN domain-containing protein [Candidatus Bipolaricaulota bacterium]